jgi:hypothetical protein
LFSAYGMVCSCVSHQCPGGTPLTHLHVSLVEKLLDEFKSPAPPHHASV